MDQHQRRNLAVDLDVAIARLRELELENEALRVRLYTDSLTSVANRHFFDENFPTLVDLAHQTNEPLALLVADVDGLKRTNDRLGHSAGDELLRAVAKTLQATARQTDLVGRHGGDEFYVILPGFSPIGGDLAELLEQTIQRYKAALHKGFESLKLAKDLHINVSFGIEVLDANETAEDFYHRVDKIAQSSKRAFYEKLQKKGVKFTDERL